MSDSRQRMEATLELLDHHYYTFSSMVKVARRTGHPVPIDTRGWSQIIVSVLTGIKGINRKKGPDLSDDSDVKGANTWEAIDTPRFNNVIKADTQAHHSDSMDYLDNTPCLFFVLWDENGFAQPRCRIWVVRPPDDDAFRAVCKRWYDARNGGEISSSNFQLHPPRGQDRDVFRNSYGNLSYPLMLMAIRKNDRFVVQRFDPNQMSDGACEYVD